MLVWCCTFANSIFVDFNIDFKIRSGMLLFGSVFKSCVNCCRFVSYMMRFQPLRPCSCNVLIHMYKFTTFD